MPCPNCHHTLHGLGYGNKAPMAWWCPRCGTLKFLDKITHPSLCERVRDLVTALHNEGNMDSHAILLMWEFRDRSVLESIGLEFNTSTLEIREKAKQPVEESK